MTELNRERLTLPGAPLGEENPLPYFRDPQTNRPTNVLPSLPAEKQEYFGWETGFRVLPYRMQDNYSRQRAPMELDTIILENDILKATFTPGLGGRLLSLFDKVQGRELLSVNPVFQPANLAIRNAWFSGGIEWNTGQYGHSVNTCSPVFAARIEGFEGEPGLRLYEFERTHGSFWQIDFYLPPGSPFLIAHTRLANPHPRDTSAYWWTNIAVPETQGLRILAPAQEAIYVDFSSKQHAFGYTEMPNLPSLDGADATYPSNSTFANEFFFQPDSADMPWEAALDPAGAGLIEASTGFLKYRKLFLWGTHQGGRHWQEFLAPGNTPYCEIQGGLAPTQLHGLPFPANTDWQWTQVFGFIQTDPALAHGPNWTAAWQSVDAELKSRLSLAELNELDAAYRERADLPAGEILFEGSGWGALELKRREKEASTLPVPASFVFPESTLGKEQAIWLALLKNGQLPEQAASEPPGDWQVQTEWYDLLKTSLQKEANQNWFAWLHLGVMSLERLDEERAAAAWQNSVRLQPNAWAYRNLAILAERQGNPAAALTFYETAWNLTTDSPALALTQEYLAALARAGRFDSALEIYKKLPETFQQDDRLLLLRGRIALELEDYWQVEQILKHDFAGIREGEIELTDLWQEMQLKRVAGETGQPITPDLREQVARYYPPPARIDFRIFT